MSPRKMYTIPDSIINKTYKMKIIRSRLLMKSVLLLILVLLNLNSGICQKIKSSGFLKETRNEYIFMNQESQLIIKKNPWKMSLSGKDGMIRFTEERAPSFLVEDKWVSMVRADKVILQEENYVKMQASFSSGEKVIVEVKSVSDNGFNIIINCEDLKVTEIRGVTTLNPVEEVYGFGEMWNGRVSQRGQSFDLWDRTGTPDECAYMPYYVSTNNYTFFLNYGGNVNFDVGQSHSGELIFQLPYNTLDMTLVSGNSVASAVQNCLAITGLPVRPPRWSFEPWFWLMQDPDLPGGSINTLTGEHLLV